MVNKLVDSTGLELLAKKLDERSKNRADELQTEVNKCIVKPDENGVAGQILSISSNGTTQWIDNNASNTKLITTEEIDEIMGTVF